MLAKFYKASFIVALHNPIVIGKACLTLKTKAAQWSGKSHFNQTVVCSNLIRGVGKRSM